MILTRSDPPTNATVHSSRSLAKVAVISGETPYSTPPHQQLAHVSKVSKCGRAYLSSGSQGSIDVAAEEGEGSRVQTGEIRAQDQGRAHMGTNNMQITCGRGRAEKGVTPRVMRGSEMDEAEKGVERDERWA